jgi:hypothetical protein
MPTSRPRPEPTTKRVTGVALSLATLAVAAALAAAPDAYTWGSDGTTSGTTDGWEIGSTDGWEVG